jgi:hypothetical protein
MSDNDASGSYDKPDTTYVTDTTYDHAAAASGAQSTKGGKAAKWGGIFVAIAGGVTVLGAIFGDDLPKCDSSVSRGMIADLYTQVPLNTTQATVAELTGIAETGHDEEAKTRTCQATLIDSAGAQHAIVWSTTDAGETYNYELEVKS